MTFALTTADPRFNPAEPVTVNGYRFVPVSTTDLATLDPMIRLFSFIASIGADGLYDDLWNFRNQLVPFAPGDEHFDEECPS